jgi:DHA1 family tetracycline resistance protein-like MFS transporter
MTIFAIVVIDLLGFSLVLPLLPYYARTFGASDITIGLVGTVYPLAQLFAAPILGRLSDRFGRRPILLVSIFGTFLGFMMLGFAGSLAMLFASRLVDGITGGNISVAQAYIADVTDEESRGRALGLIGAAFGIGFILGPITGGLLSRFGYGVPAFAAAGLTLLNLIAVAAFVPESLTRETRARLAERPHKGLDLRALAEALSHPRVGPLLWMKVFAGLAFSIFESGFSLWALHALGITAEVNGYILAYVGVLSVLVQVALIGRLTARFSDAWLIVGALATSALALGAWGLSTTIVMLLVVLVPTSIGLAVTNTILASATSKAVHPDEVGGIFGLTTSIQSLMRIPAPLLAAVLLERVGNWAPGVGAALLVAPLVPYAYRRLIGDPPSHLHAAPGTADEAV